MKDQFIILTKTDFTPAIFNVANITIIINSGMGDGSKVMTVGGTSLNVEESVDSIKEILGLGPVPKININLNLPEGIID